jgi:D-sedoheptulose 7-phosphate isomerase
MPRDWKTVLHEHQQLMASLADQAETLDRITAAIVHGLRAGGRVYVFGNGGSAADAQHIACELLGRFKRERQALPVIALTTDSSTLTAIANDLGYEQVFARQLDGLVRPGDVVWALSTSGDSPNVIAAVKLAAARGAITVGFTGQLGGALAHLCKHLLPIQHASSDRIQEGHSVAYHYICERVEEAFAHHPEVRMADHANSE